MMKKQSLVVAIVMLAVMLFAMPALAKTTVAMKYYKSPILEHGDGGVVGQLIGESIEISETEYYRLEAENKATKKPKWVLTKRLVEKETSDIVSLFGALFNVEVQTPAPAQQVQVIIEQPAPQQPAQKTRVPGYLGINSEPWHYGFGRSVTYVAPGSPAANAGIKPGFVLLFALTDAGEIVQITDVAMYFDAGQRLRIFWAKPLHNGYAWEHGSSTVVLYNGR